MGEIANTGALDAIIWNDTLSLDKVVFDGITVWESMTAIIKDNTWMLSSSQIGTVGDYCYDDGDVSERNSYFSSANLTEGIARCYEDADDYIGHTYDASWIISLGKTVSQIYVEGAVDTYGVDVPGPYYSQYVGRVITHKERGIVINGVWCPLGKYSYLNDGSPDNNYNSPSWIELPTSTDKLSINIGSNGVSWNGDGSYNYMKNQHTIWKIKNLWVR